ncbi:class I SAM-dependent methyltransferase [Nocardia otitidiscaviarum]|uniref:SAM-dependent methyltransferase n=1 Tax=Nocardia otitidiscaviarum TaxID=1823 RepID=UPI0004A6F51A|nr:class I SAM-dependent methyltransferase [Nocardia otitidiscaviarum]MBF6131502.1 class I SAM-dependent methyltransferase [Nocardia otitidiscaviarum]MBF6482648.1 class I SAM-dependent methyltransferase [Nocardia otitidiscaviarum]
MNPSVETWNAVYDNDTAPWVIGEPQPAIVALERAGWIRGRVLDPGSGAGEHTILLTRLGYDVRGVDLSPSAVEYARRNAAAQGVPSARFDVADALHLAESEALAVNGRPPAFDTIVDSALFHIFGEEPELRAEYVRSLRSVCEPGGRLHILALSNREPGIGPRIGDDIIRESFTDGWELEELSPSRYLGRVTEPVAAEAQGLQVRDGRVNVAAWLTRLRRL